MSAFQKLKKYLVIFLCFSPWIAGIALVHVQQNVPPSPLRDALFNRRVYEAKKILMQGHVDDYNTRSDWSSTPLIDVTKYFSSWRGQSVDGKELIDLLFASDADVNEAGWLCNTALHEAAKINDEQGSNNITQWVKMLLAHGAEVDRKDCHGRTPLMLAASVGSRPVVQELLHAGANPSLQEKDGKTALEFAKTPEIANIILEWRPR